MNTYDYDVLIIGCGVAGLSSGIKLAEQNLRVGIVTRCSDPNETNTKYAQGGIVYAKENDEFLKHDLLKASSSTSYDDAVNLLQFQSGRIVNELLIEKVKANFEKDNNGNLCFTREAAHSIDRIIYLGDHTGNEIQISLLNYLNDKKRFPNVSFLTSHTAIDLLTPLHHGVNFSQRYEPNRVVGAYLLNRKTHSVVKVIAKNTILATGGIGALYLHHSNAEGARGDGHAMAARAGATLTDMEFVQFHPTTFFDRSTHRRFLISEAVRGEGGRLLNSKGESFMSHYHPDEEMAPRDVVARSIVEESIKTNHDCVYLDITHLDSDWLRRRFPTINEHCLKNNIDITKDLIPVVPAAHYSCGGVKTDLKGRTSVPGLYAVGEVACTGLHGANRLASTSLLEGLTWGYIAAENISNSIEEYSMYDSYKIKDWVDGSQYVDSALVRQDWQTLKQTMWNYVGLFRSQNRLGRAGAMLRELYYETQKFYKDARLFDSLIGIRNAIEVGRFVLHASRKNKKSIGCFFLKEGPRA